MAKAIKETIPDTNLNISTAEIVQARADIRGMRRGQYGVNRVCTKTDNALKGIMKAHLEERTSSKQASYQSSKG